MTDKRTTAEICEAGEKALFRMHGRASYSGANADRGDLRALIRRAKWLDENYKIVGMTIRERMSWVAHHQNLALAEAMEEEAADANG